MKKKPNRWLQAGINLAIIVALLTAVSFLPPDTSLRDRERLGVLKVCVPPSYPPLVTGDPQRPGYDIELVTAIAERLGLRLTVNTLTSIGSDFNPRNWTLTRAQCDLVAGGVADTVQTRSFLQTIPTEAETGWVMLSKDGAAPAEGSDVAVLPGTSGLDRVALSTWLRSSGLRGRPTQSLAEFRARLERGETPAGITERFLAAESGLEAAGFSTTWLPQDSFPSQKMAIGLWKGDQTLTRAVSSAVSELKRSGQLGALADKYHLDGEIGHYKPPRAIDRAAGGILDPV